MYADGNNEPRTVAEEYAGAVSSGSTRVGNDSGLRTSGDIVAAAGMSTYRMGMALMRLMSEWQSGATPPAADAPSAREIRRDTGADAEYAEAEARLLAARSADWHLHENKLRFQRLKTLPAVRAALLHWVGERGWEDGEQVVAETLQHFLAPVCPACQGRKRKVIPGTSRAIGKECTKCKGTGDTGRDLRGRHRSLLSHIRSCTARAAGDLREGAHRLRRGEQSEEDRAKQKFHSKVQELQRADAQDQADAKQDQAAVAAHFRDSMGARRRR